MLRGWGLYQILTRPVETLDRRIWGARACLDECSSPAGVRDRAQSNDLTGCRFARPQPVPETRFGRPVDSCETRIGCSSDQVASLAATGSSALPKDRRAV